MRRAPLRFISPTVSAERGQVLPVVAVAMSILIAFAGLAIDVGRQAAERRYLQNAVDAAALAGCNALIDNATDAEAAQAAYDAAVMNLGRSPSGTPAQLAPLGSAVYEQGRPGDPSNLINGIVVTSDGTVRAAIRANVDTVLARVLGVTQVAAGARAMCTTMTYPDLPIVARRYFNPAGPNRTRGRTPAARQFVDYLATAGSSTLGIVDVSNVLGYDVRTAASRDFPGPIYQIYGPQSKASNAAWYHGLAIYDIRNFQDDNSRVYYNGVPLGAQPSTQKSTAWSYITLGYPGPGFPPVQRSGPPEPNNQVAVIAGLNAAQVMGAFNSVYDVYDEVVLPVYYGNVQQIADFTITPPPEIVVDSSGSISRGPVFTVARDNSFRDPVTLTLQGDNDAQFSSPARPEYDLIDEGAQAATRGKMTAGFSPNGFTPATAGTRVQLVNIVTNNVPAGIYTVWLQGTSGAPLNRINRYPVAVSVGGAVKDFDLRNSSLNGETATAGATISLPIYVSTTTDAEGWGNGTPVQLSVDSRSLPAGLPASQVTFSSSQVTPSSSGFGALSTLTVNTAGLGPGEYTFTLRATGTNGDRQPVTHLETVTINVQTSTGDSRYIDLIGWANFKITEIGANYFNGQAISAVHATPDALELRPQHFARLIPWQ